MQLSDTFLYELLKGQSTATKEIWIDFDGTLVYHCGSLEDIYKYRDEPVLLDGVKERLKEWKEKNYYINLVTARPEGFRYITQKQLEILGILEYIDEIHFGKSHGERIIINDEKPNGFPSARAIIVKRDKGLGDVNL